MRIPTTLIVGPNGEPLRINTKNFDSSRHVLWSDRDKELNHVRQDEETEETAEAPVAPEIEPEPEPEPEPDTPTASLPRRRGRPRTR